MRNPETGLPGPLDVVLRDLHVMWCEQEGCAVIDPSGHLLGADPEHAALLLCLAIWEFAEHASESDCAALERLSTLVAKIENWPDDQDVEVEGDR